MPWYFSLIFATLFISASNGFARAFAGKIHPVFSTAIVGLTAFIITGIWSLVASQVGQKPFATTKEAVFLAIGSGAVWSVGQLLWFTTLSHAPLAIALPIISGGIGVVGVLTGVLFFHETLTLLQIVGIVTVLFGSVLVTLPK